MKVGILRMNVFHAKTNVYIFADTRFSNKNYKAYEPPVYAQQTHGGNNSLDESIFGAEVDRRLLLIKPKNTWKPIKTHRALEVKSLVPTQIVDFC